MTDELRIKNAILAAKEAGEVLDSDVAWDRMAGKIAAAVVVEIKNLKINYSGGLTSPSGAVTGTINHTIS